MILVSLQGNVISIDFNINPDIYEVVGVKIVQSILKVSSILKTPNTTKATFANTV